MLNHLPHLILDYRGTLSYLIALRDRARIVRVYGYASYVDNLLCQTARDG
jgi:hypothetical protein